MVQRRSYSCHCSRWTCQLGKISLLDRGCDVNAADNMGYIALHLPVASKSGQSEVVRELLEDGSDVELRTASTSTHQIPVNLV